MLGGAERPTAFLKELGTRQTMACVYRPKVAMAGGDGELPEHMRRRGVVVRGGGDADERVEGVG